MHIVSETSEAELARKRKEDAVHNAMARVRSALVELGANLLRVTRGAGKSYELGTQANRFVEALISYQEAAGCYPDAVSLNGVLDFGHDEEFLSKLKGDARDEYYAKQAILRGALQTVASQMLGQLTIQRSGEKELSDGIQHLNGIREKRRKLHEAEWRQSIRAKKPRQRPKPTP